MIRLQIATQWAIISLPLILGACDSVPDPPKCRDGTPSVDGKCPQPVTISLNMVGFLPERVKLASVPEEFEDFAVVREDGSVAYEGKASGPEPKSKRWLSGE